MNVIQLERSVLVLISVERVLAKQDSWEKSVQNVQSDTVDRIAPNVHVIQGEQCPVVNANPIVNARYRNILDELVL